MITRHSKYSGIYNECSSIAILKNLHFLINLEKLINEGILSMIAKDRAGLLIS